MLQEAVEVKVNPKTYSKVLIETPFGTLVVRTAGAPDAELVAAVHGWSQRNSWQTWEPLMPLLSEAGFFVGSLDMPGWGDSQPWQAGPLSTELAVKALISVADHFDKQDFVLMGKSWGGAVSIQCAMEYPTRVASLILSAPAFQNLEALSALTQPVLLVWAEDDPVIPYRYSKEYERRIPNVELISYKSGGHSAAPRNAEDFGPRAVKFLQSSFKRLHQV